MTQQLSFSASLPRVGSTLLQNILGQNPLIYPTPTSPFIGLVTGVREAYTKTLDHYYGNDRLKWEEDYLAFLRGGIKGYLSNLTDKPLIIDKHRNWSGYYSFLEKIIPNPKIIYLVRDLRSILSSLEKKHRQHPEQDDNIMAEYLKEGGGVFTTSYRCNWWLSSHLLGKHIDSLKQIVLDKTYTKFHFIRYEDLCTNPEEELKKIYQYLELPYFKHDFNNIKQITFENDEMHGVYGDHTIKSKLSFPKEDFKEILGEEISEGVYQDNKWYFDMFGYRK